MERFNGEPRDIPLDDRKRKTGEKIGKGQSLRELRFNKIQHMRRFVHTYIHVHIYIYIHICVYTDIREKRRANRGRYQYARCATGRS